VRSCLVSEQAKVSIESKFVISGCLGESVKSMFAEAFATLEKLRLTVDEVWINPELFNRTERDGLNFPGERFSDKLSLFGVRLGIDHSLKNNQMRVLHHPTKLYHPTKCYDDSDVLGDLSLMSVRYLELELSLCSANYLIEFEL
jgi:hypothetical protein